jgi:hypothetical protein
MSLALSLASALNITISSRLLTTSAITLRAAASITIHPGFDVFEVWNFSVHSSPRAAA